MLKNQVAIVTGASRGIGKAIALTLAREGAKLVIGGTDGERLALVDEELCALGVNCVAVVGDIALPQTAFALTQAALNTFGGIDIVVNNAGFNQRASFLTLEEADWRRMLDVNLNGAFYLLREALPQMANQGRGGAVVNVSSSAAKTPHLTAAASYAASKGALNALTRQLAFEMARYRIRVNAVCPGPIETDMSGQWSDEYRQALLQRIPLGRLGSVQDVAEAVAFLASDRAGFITGETININGGTYMD